MYSEYGTRLPKLPFLSDNQEFATHKCSPIIRLRKMLRQHLSFMEHPRHDDIVRVVDIKSDQMSGLEHRWADWSFAAPFQVVEKITLPDVIDGLHADSVCVGPEIFQCLVDKLPITLARLAAEFCTTVSKYLGDVASRWAGDANPPHTLGSRVEIVFSSLSTLSN